MLSYEKLNTRMKSVEPETQKNVSEENKSLEPISYFELNEKTNENTIELVIEEYELLTEADGGMVKWSLRGIRYLFDNKTISRGLIVNILKNTDIKQSERDRISKLYKEIYQYAKKNNMTMNDVVLDDENIEIQEKIDKLNDLITYNYGVKFSPAGKTGAYSAAILAITFIALAVIGYVNPRSFMAIVRIIPFGEDILAFFFNVFTGSGLSGDQIRMWDMAERAKENALYIKQALANIPSMITKTSTEIDAFNTELSGALTTATGTVNKLTNTVTQNVPSTIDAIKNAKDAVSSTAFNYFASSK